MIRIVSLLALLAALALAGGGCRPSADACPVEGHAPNGDPTAHAGGGEVLEAEAGPQPTRVLEDGARLFGAELGDAAPVALSEIAARPEAYAGRVVRTEGRIERVCQRMGCWMELRGETTAPVRVPMAGHAFFLPRDVEGREATIEGRVAVEPLSEGRRRHLEAEGALATASTLSIDATSVVVR